MTQTTAFAPLLIQDADDGPGVLNQTDVGKFMACVSQDGRLVFRMLDAPANPGAAPAFVRVGGGAWSIQNATDGPGTLTNTDIGKAVTWAGNGHFVMTAFEASGAVSAHAAITTNVHGIADTSLLIAQTVAVSAGARNILSGSPANTISDGADACIILGGGTTAFPNIINGTNPSLCTIVGAYDVTLTGELANGIIASPHSIIQATTTHCIVVGGSTLLIGTGADYAAGIGGLSNTISADYAAAIGGDHNTVSGTRSLALGGNGNTVSGLQAVALAGNNNTASGQYSVVSGVNSIASDIGGVALGTNAKNYSVSAAISGGDSNTMGSNSVANRADYSGALGGLSNTIGGAASGRFSGIVGSRSSTIDAEYGGILGGRETTIATEQFQSAVGYRAAGVLYAAHNQGSGFFAAAGDAQYIRCVARNTTTNNSATPLWLDGSTKNMVLPNNTTWAFSALISARRTDSAGNAAYRVEGTIVRGANAASATLAGATTTAIYESDAAWDVSASANTTAGCLRLNVTGATGATIRWVAMVSITQVSG